MEVCVCSGTYLVRVSDIGKGVVNDGVHGAPKHMKRGGTCSYCEIVNDGAYWRKCA